MYLCMLLVFVDICSSVAIRFLCCVFGIDFVYHLHGELEGAKPY